MGKFNNDAPPRQDRNFKAPNKAGFKKGGDNKFRGAKTYVQAHRLKGIYVAKGPQ